MKYQNNSVWKLSLATLAAVLLCCTINTAPAQNVPQIAEKTLAATVSLEMKDSKGKTRAFGSGFFVRENLIATNYHVIAEAASGTAKLVDKDTTYEIEGFTATDETNDLALLKVTAYGIKPLPLGNSTDVKIGETVYVAGNPKGLEGTFSDGMISGRRYEDAKERLQMTAPVSRGSSGGPVLNSKGEVIGVASRTIEDGQNLNFAIPSNYLKTLLTLSKPAKPLAHGNQTVSAGIYFRQGYMMYELKRYQEAIVAYNKAIQLKPDFATAYNNRGIAKSDLGQLSAAISDYDKAIQLKPDYATAYYNRGNAKSALGEHFAAISDYDKAIQLKPDYATAYNNRGIAKSNLGEHSAAISDYDKVIQLKPDYADAYNGRGVAKHLLGEHIAAISDYDKAIQRKPDYADAYHNRGLTKSALGEYLAAISDYDKAIQLKPDYATAYFGRGNAKSALGQHSAAISDYDKAIQLKPDYADAYHNRGLAKAMLNRTGEAKQDFQAALRLAEKAGDDNTKARAEKALQSLE